MKGEAEVTGQLWLRDACFPATQTDSPPHLDVRDPGRSWVELLGRTRPRFGFLAHGEIILQPKGDGKGGQGNFYSILGGLGIIDLAQGPHQSEGDHSFFPALSTRRRLFAVPVRAISYSGPILFNVRQRTFVCQRLAKVAVLNPRAAMFAPIAVLRH